MALVIVMAELQLPDAHYLSAAIGWLELGNPAEARLELDQISTPSQCHLDVLEARWTICIRDQNWKDGLRTARALLEAAPETSSGWVYQAYALRRATPGGLRRAWNALLPAYERFPKEAVIPFNLACYACQLRKLKTARTWLKRAIRHFRRIHHKALGAAGTGPRTAVARDRQPVIFPLGKAPAVAHGVPESAVKRKRVQILYSGSVQGVGFRYTVKRIATGYEITGTIRNLPDGRVELVAEGLEDELEAFRQAIRESGLGHFMQEGNVSAGLAARNEFRGFEIVR